MFAEETQSRCVCSASGDSHTGVVVRSGTGQDSSGAVLSLQFVFVDTGLFTPIDSNDGSLINVRIDKVIGFESEFYGGCKEKTQNNGK